MEKQLLAVGFENYSNYIKLPESVLTEFNKPKNSDTLSNYNYTKPKNGKNKGINLREQLALTDVKILPPYYFSIESTFGKFTYCGVLDFTADEGMCMIPHGVMANLDVYGSDFVTIRYIANVPKGDFVQLEPIQREIFEIPELDKYLETVISNYCLLYPNQILTCFFAGEQYSIKVKIIKSVCEFDVEPELIDIVNTDLKIDIFNKFLEEELIEKEKQRLKMIEEEKERKRIEEVEKAKQLNQQTSPNPLFAGNGYKLGGGIETSDPVLMREIRLQKFLALQEQNRTTQIVQNKVPDVKNQTSQVSQLAKIQANLAPDERPKPKPPTKSKDIDL